MGGSQAAFIEDAWIDGAGDSEMGDWVLIIVSFVVGRGRRCLLFEIVMKWKSRSELWSFWDQASLFGVCRKNLRDVKC